LNDIVSYTTKEILDITA
jgi:hypothetical protein